MKAADSRNWDEAIAKLPVDEAAKIHAVSTYTLR